jgi:hypothetical protein
MYALEVACCAQLAPLQACASCARCCVPLGLWVPLGATMHLLIALVDGSLTQP